MAHISKVKLEKIAQISRVKLETMAHISKVKLEKIAQISRVKLETMAHISQVELVRKITVFIRRNFRNYLFKIQNQTENRVMTTLFL
jgi:hypothetical protein